MKTKPKMTKAEMRVAIAKDVLRQIAAEKFIPTQGDYLTAWDKHGVETERINQKTVTRPGFMCHVCALGAAIISGVRLFNKIDVVQRDYDTEVLFSSVKKWFSASQILLIETAFEGQTGPVSSRCGYNREMVQESYDFYLRNGEDDDEAALMIDIFKNIIKNKGTFKP